MPRNTLQILIVGQENEWQRHKTAFATDCNFDTIADQTLLTATSLAGKFNVSVRTIYRDIRALEQSGVPILIEDGKGYTLMEGYKIPPVMFTEKQANALILAEQLILKNKDASFIEDYLEAIDKIKAVLGQKTKLIYLQNEPDLAKT